jgi:hypothetical protein
MYMRAMHGGFAPSFASGYGGQRGSVVRVMTKIERVAQKIMTASGPQQLDDPREPCSTAMKKSVACPEQAASRHRVASVRQPSDHSIGSVHWV